MVDLLSVSGLFGIVFIVVTLLMTVALTWLGMRERGPASADAETEDEAAAGS